MIHVVSKRLNISMIVGVTMSIHSFSRLVGIGSISHDFVAEVQISLLVSSRSIS